MHIATIASPSQACHHYRSCLPFRYLAVDHPQHQWSVSTSDQIGGFDALYVYGTLRSLSDWGQIASLKRKGIKVIWGHDDNVWQHPEWRKDGPTAEHIHSVNMACELADLIVASTPALAEAIGKPAKTVVCPNLVEVDRYRTPTPPAYDGLIRICWSGAGGHWADLQLIDSSCCRIKEKYGSKVAFYFVGDIPDRMFRDHLNNNVQLIEWFPLAEYWSVLHQVRPHIFLAPLCDCPFNHSKSNLRVMEGWSLNAAVVASAVGEYRVIDNGFDGLFAHNEDQWFRQLVQLIEDRGLREQLAQTGYDRVKREFDWSNRQARLKWKPAVDAIEGLFGVG